MVEPYCIIASVFTTVDTNICLKLGASYNIIGMLKKTPT